MSKVLVISTSLRAKSNSDILTGRLIDGAKDVDVPQISPDSAAEMVIGLYKNGMPLRSAAKEIAAKTGLSRNELYDAALKLKDEQEK